MNSETYTDYHAVFNEEVNTTPPPVLCSVASHEYSTRKVFDEEESFTTICAADEGGGMEIIMKLGHVALYTKDMNKSIEFYSLFGGKKGSESILDLGDGTSEHLIHMEFDGESTVELVCLSDPSMIPEENGICGHFCFDVKNVDEVVKELRAKGVDTFDAEEPYNLPIFGGIRVIFLTGPSGESIELLQWL